MDKNQSAASTTAAKASLKEAIGKITGNEPPKPKGAAGKAKGEAHQAPGDNKNGSAKASKK